MLPGVFRLRLPLPWPGVPHCNAWAVAAGDGVVLFDTGMHQPGSLAHLERALDMCNLRLENVRLVVCTHAHSDHYGQAAPIVERAGCELWMHPNHEHMLRWAQDPGAALARRLEVARQSGVPEEPLRRYAAERESRESGIAGGRRARQGARAGGDRRDRPRPMDRARDPRPCPLARLPVPARAAPSDLRRSSAGAYLAALRLTASPPIQSANSSTRSTSSRLLHARLCLAGHGRTFADVHAHIEGQPRARAPSGWRRSSP